MRGWKLSVSPSRPGLSLQATNARTARCGRRQSYTLSERLVLRRSAWTLASAWAAGRTRIHSPASYPETTRPVKLLAVAYLISCKIVGSTSRKYTNGVGSSSFTSWPMARLSDVSPRATARTLKTTNGSTIRTARPFRLPVALAPTNRTTPIEGFTHNGLER
jgi:hypothetical protein